MYLSRVKLIDGGKTLYYNSSHLENYRAAGLTYPALSHYILFSLEEEEQKLVMPICPVQALGYAHCGTRSKIECPKDGAGNLTISVEVKWSGPRKYVVDNSKEGKCLDGKRAWCVPKDKVKPPVVKQRVKVDPEDVVQPLVAAPNKVSATVIDTLDTIVEPHTSDSEDSGWFYPILK